MTDDSRVVVVTGGGSGIGRAIVERLAFDGYRVAVADILALEQLSQTLCDISGDLYWARCDVASRDDVNSFMAGVMDRFGQVDGLVLNAGIYPVSSFVDMTEDEWHRVFQVNVDQLFYFSQACLPDMCSRAWGRIVAISSTTFHAGVPQQVHYVASKGAVIGFVRSLAAEVGNDGVTVNSIAPGLVRTEHTESGPQRDLFEVIAQQQAIARTESPHDLTGPVSFLLSDDAGFITGQTIVVDGGWVRS